MGLKVPNSGGDASTENGSKPAPSCGITRQSHQGSVRHPEGISPELRKILDRKRQKSKEQQNAT